MSYSQQLWFLTKNSKAISVHDADGTMLDINMFDGSGDWPFENWKFGGTWKEKLCPGYRPTTTEEPTTTSIPAWKTAEPTVLPSVCEPSLIQVMIYNF